MKIMVPPSRMDVSRSLCFSLGIVALSALLAGCPEQHPVTAKQPTTSATPAASAPSASTTPPAAAPSTPAPAAAPQTQTAENKPPTAPTTPVAPTPPPPPPVLGFDEAVAKAARAVFTNAPPPESSSALVLIDPLVDGMSGYQSKATQSIQDHITQIVKTDFPQYAIHSINPDNLKQKPRVLIGTFTAVNAEMKTAGVRESYRFCLVMGDLSTGKIVAKSVARARLADVDATPTAAFSDSPVWLPDPSIQAYIATCQASKVGDAIKAEYIDGLVTAALINEAGDAYNERHYSEALDLYRTARKSSAGDQLRVYNGIYMSLSKSGRTDRDEQEAAFHDLVDYGLRRKQLGVRFAFRPGSVRFVADNFSSRSYDMWLRQIADQAVQGKACLQITGHTSPTGTAALNDSLSLTRAEYIQSRLEQDQPGLKKRTVAAGKGSRENIIGTGRDDASDEIDRRVELKPIDPCN